MQSADARVIAVRQGDVLAAGSWLYVWVDVSDGVIAYVGATTFDPELRTHLHLTSPDPGIGRVRASIRRFEERDFDVLAFALPNDSSRPAAKQALLSRLAEAGLIDAQEGGASGEGAPGEAMPEVVEPIVAALRDHVGRLSRAR